MPLEALDAFVLALLYLVAFALRWELRSAQPYTAEAFHFFVAANLWDSVTNVVGPDMVPLDASWFFWQRPFLTLPFWPFAAHSFAAYRAAHIVLTATIPALGFWLLRSLGIRRPAASVAAFVLAVHPALLSWGVLFLPDSLVLALVLAALLAAHHGRPAGTAILLWCASWVKEIAFVTALSLLVLALWRDGDGRRAGLRPFHVGPFARWLAPVVPLAFLPLAVSVWVGGAFPGFRDGAFHREMYESLFLLIWLAPLPLAGLLHARTRRFTLVALAWPAFFLVYHYQRGKVLEAWYFVLPASFTLLAAAAALDGLARVRGPVRRAAPVLAVAIVAMLWVQVFVPAQDEHNQQVATPLTGRGQWDLEQVQAFELMRDDGLAELIQIPGEDERSVWVVADLEPSLLYYPISDQADLVHAFGMTPAPANQSVFRDWQWAVENATDVTLVVVRDDVPGNVATRRAYEECSVTRSPFVLIQAKHCQGAGDDLWEQYLAAGGAQGPA